MRIFKKPLFWTILAAVIAVAAGTVIGVAIPSARFPKNASVRIRDTGSDVDGIVFEVRSVHVERGSLRFDLRWKNDSGNDISFGSFFELYKNESGKWVKMPQVRAVGYNVIAYMLNSGSTRDQTFDITAPYNLAVGEKYRFMAEFYVASDSDSTEQKYTWIDFEVAKDPSDDGVTSEKNAEYRKITAKEAYEKMQFGGVTVVDVRTKAEYDEGHIPGAILLPNENIGSTVPEELPEKDAVILVYCRSGRRSRKATEKLLTIGYRNVYDFGGIIDWPYEKVK